MPCPATCPPLDPVHNVFHHQNTGAKNTNMDSLSLNNHFRDEYLLKFEGNGPLVEMYYSVSSAINEKMNAVKKSNSLEENEHRLKIQDFNNLVNAGDYDEAKTMFESIIKNMMNTYLFQ
jgi:hypothetical protein